MEYTHLEKRKRILNLEIKTAENALHENLSMDGLGKLIQANNKIIIAGAFSIIGKWAINKIQDNYTEEPNGQIENKHLFTDQIFDIAKDMVLSYIEN